MRFDYDRVQNIVKCGYELNRLAFILNLFSLWQSYSLSSVIGIVFIVLSYACVYFSESVKVAYDDEEAGLKLDIGVLAFTTLSFVMWLLTQTVWR